MNQRMDTRMRRVGRLGADPDHRGSGALMCELPGGVALSLLTSENRPHQTNGGESQGPKTFGPVRHPSTIRVVDRALLGTGTSGTRSSTQGGIRLAEKWEKRLSELLAQLRPRHG